MNKHPKKAKGFKPFPGLIPQRAQDPSSYDDKLFVWRAQDKYLDYDNAKLGWNKIEIRELLGKVIQGLHSYEGQKWHEVRCREHCCNWELDEIPPEFLRRLQELQIDIDRIFQISLSNTRRVFGHVDRQIFYLIWYDPDHRFWPMKK